MSMNEPMAVFNVIETEDGKGKWIQVGTAYLNKDGSINAILDVYPRDGKLQIRKKRTAGDVGRPTFEAAGADEK